MESRLETLLWQIGPDLTYDQVSARVDHAFNSFRFELGMITKMPEFERTGANFYCHLENGIFRIQPPRKTEFEVDWARFYNQLVKIYGKNGRIAAFEIILSNSEGGLYSVLKAVAKSTIEEYVENEIRARVFSFWDDISTDMKFEVMDHFITKFKHLFPNEIRMHGTTRIKANFPKYLIEYPRMLKRTRDMASNF